MTCHLPGVVFIGWAVLILLGLDRGDSLVPFLIVEGLAMILAGRALRVKYPWLYGRPHDD